jgi:hypothetical protein
MLVTLVCGIFTRVFGIDFVISGAVWCVAYIIMVILLYIAKIPKEFAFGNEIQLLLQHYCAFIIVFVFVDNSIALFK